MCARTDRHVRGVTGDDPDAEGQVAAADQRDSGARER